MDRKILFRGKSSTKGWLFGDLLQMDGKTSICVEETDGYWSRYIVDEKTVCQYTGLTDKNGRKIFEGDIVKTSQYGVDDGNGHNYAGFDTFSVEFSDGGFCLKNKWRRFNLRPERDFEVIGNIFDNEELLNQ